ncbi:ATP-binding protein [Fibrella sp. WM1]|uniref:sensor histidine kinase n=1 Tax=Fibrella musci TaxID=3242485 RepID=UPI00351FC422
MTLKRTNLLIATAFLCIFLLLSLTTYLSWQSNQREQQVNEQVRDTYEVIAQIEQLTNASRDLQTDARSYELTGKREFLQSFRSVSQKLPQQLTQLDWLLRQQPQAQAQVRELGQLINQRLGVSQQLINQRQTVVSVGSEELLKQGRQLLFQMRPIAKALNDQQRALVEARLQQAQAAYQTTQQRIGLVTGSALAVMAFLLWVLYGQLRRRMRNEAKLAQLDVELQHQLQQEQAHNQALDQLNQQLRQSNENLQQFAYIASHDLQEPLRKIQQFGDLLKARYNASGDAELERDYLSRMQTAAKRMSLLIKDLLAFSRISAQPVADTQVDLTIVLEQTLDNLSVAIQETNAQLTIGPLPTVVGETFQLGQLFQNLLSNAIKFHRPGNVPHVQVRASELADAQLPATVKPTQASARYHQIDIVDDGIGFDEKYLHQIFQVFQRLHGRNEFVGTGIGLAICQKVVVNHGGAITAVSQPGGGSCFSVYLPAQAMKADQLPA